MRSRRLAALALLALAAAIAGCGGDDSEPSDATAAFGAEAGVGDRSAIATTTERFLAAQAEGRWEEACSLMTTTVREQVEGLADGSRRIKGKRCRQILGAIFRQNPAQLQASADGIEIETVRVQGAERGYVFYSTPQVEAAYLPLEREAGEWKVATISGSSPPSQQGGD